MTTNIIKLSLSIHSANSSPLPGGYSPIFHHLAPSRLATPVAAALLRPDVISFMVVGA